MLNYFFRSEPDGFVFTMFSPLHFLIMAITIAGIIYISVNYKKVPASFKMIYRICLFIIVLEQILLYPWYYFSFNFDPQVSLPMYSCRMAMLLFIFGELFKRKKAKYIASYLGLPGGIIALIFPVLDNYSFPHLTNFTYFVGHVALSWLCILFLLTDRSDNKYLKESIIFINIYIFATLFVDLRYDANYAYLLWAPIFYDTFAKLSPIVYFAFVYSLYALIFVGVYYLFKRLNPSAPLIISSSCRK